MQERQRQKELLYEQREDRKRRMMRYSEAYTTDGSDTSRSNTPENDSAADTPSECSIATPKNPITLPEVEIRPQSVEATDTTHAEKEDTDKIDEAESAPNSRHEPTKVSMFTASLNRPCDFRYDRFSTFMETPVSLKTEESEDIDSSSEEESDEGSEDDYSPIEIATPIAIRMPISRPSVISVVTTPNSDQTPSKFSVKNINTIMIHPPKPRLQRTDSIPTPQSVDCSVSPAKETKPVEISTPSSASIISVEPSSSQSVISSEQTSVESSLRKKASMPMLTRAHARMNSIKNFIKPQSISGPPPAVPMIPSNHQPRPSESLNNILSSSSATHKSKLSVADNQDRLSARRSLTEPSFLTTLPQSTRPQTARTTSHTGITTQEPPLPVYSPPTPPPEPVTPYEQADEPAISRKKSFSNLRRRSGSLGQALKFSSGRTKSLAPDLPPPPPVPTIRVSSNELMQVLTPAPKTPKSFRKSGMNLYSAFPSGQKGQPVGLGLRM